MARTPTRAQPSRPPARARARAVGPKGRGRGPVMLRVGLGVVAGALVLFALSKAGGGGSSASDGGPRFDVGAPGPGEPAPPVRLASTTGDTYDLGAAKGKTVLLYFQEGIMCQPCWDQIRDIEKSMAQFRSLGIDEMVSISVDQLRLLRQKLADEDLTTPALSDPDVSLGESYGANQYGMMGTSTYGHSFVVVGPDGTIRWRADYGGAPDHTMYVAVPALLDDLRQGLAATG